MKGKLVIITFIISILLLLIVIISNYQSVEKPATIEVDYFVTNNTWETWIKKQVPYKKWDEIEISVILKNYSKYKMIYDLWIEKLIQLLKLTNVNVIANDEDINSNDAKVVKITWTTQDSWITPENLQDYININNNTSKKENEEINKNEIVENNQILEDNELHKTTYDIELSKYEIISNESNLITLTGKDISKIKGVGIGEVVYFVKSYSWINYISIDEKSLNNWIHLIYFLLKNDELRASENSMNVKTFKENVYVSNIMPNKFSNQNSRRITVQWKWLRNTISIQLSNNQVFKKVEFKIVSDSVLALNIWKNFPVWTYNMNIMTLGWIYEISDYNFTVTE